jgi:hypothetical protein
VAEVILLLKSDWTPPSPAQAEAGNYYKPEVKWQGLTIKIENPAGSVREDTKHTPPRWRTKMTCDYGYVTRSEGVDGDEVDVYLGPDLETARYVFVVHQRKYGDWDKFDEDKCMIGFLSKDTAREAYLKHYDDPRFLGPISAVPVDVFVDKVRATYEKPAMIKSVVLFLKSERAPSVGDRVEFQSDRHTDKGPSGGKITETKVTVDGLYVRIKHSDEERLFSWDDISEGATKKGDLWLLKSQVRAHQRRGPGGKIVIVGPYSNRVQARPDQADMFDAAGNPAGSEAARLGAYRLTDKEMAQVEKFKGGAFGDKAVGVYLKQRAKGASHKLAIDLMKQVEAARNESSEAPKPAVGPKAAPTAEDQADPRRKYYVTMVRDPGPNQRVGYLAGPFDRHDDALKHVEPARLHAEKVDPRAAFDAFGTAGVVVDKHGPGVLNRHLGLPH